MNKLRASYTVLNMWASGNWEQAVKYYFKLERITTPAMEAGKVFHQNWETEISKTQKLPDVFGGLQLKNPQAELFLTAQMHDWLELVGRIDLYDEPTIYEFKSGKTSSLDYARSKQTGTYAVLATLNNMLVKRAEIFHFDQHKKQKELSVVWITDSLLKESLNWIETVSSEMHSYLEDNKLYQRFGAQQ